MMLIWYMLSQLKYTRWLFEFSLETISFLSRKTILFYKVQNRIGIYFKDMNIQMLVQTKKGNIS